MKADDLERRLAALRQRLIPERDLWPAIERSIRETARSRGEQERFPLRKGRRIGLVAAAACVALATGGIALFLSRPSPDTEPMLLARVAEAERRYDNARQELLRSLRDLSARYGDSPLSYNTELAAIDRHMKELKAAVSSYQADLKPAFELAGLYRSHAGAFESASSLVRFVADQEE